MKVMHITQKTDQNFPLILTGQYNQFQGCVLFVLFSWASRSSQFDSMIKTFPMVVISKIILSLHILCWRLEIRPGIALRLRANLVLLGRRRWKRFLEYWEGKTLQNFFYSSSSYFQCLSFLQFLSYFYFDFNFNLNFHCYIYFDFFCILEYWEGKTV